METEVECPHCGERLTLSLDTSGGAVQQYVEDCSVCCRPIDVTVTLHAIGLHPGVRVRRLDD